MILLIDKKNKIIVMKFLLIGPVIRFVFFLLDQTWSNHDINEYEEDWSNPSEHNVWW